MSPFEFFFKNGPQTPGPSARNQRALGSGFIFDDKGHVLTNAHVVDGANAVKVKLSDERELHAKVVGKDDRLDVAVLQIEGAQGLPFVAFGSSAALQVGEPVVAIGNPFGLGHTVTSGIVSAKGRAIGAGAYDDFIQTDASINPGNSGGPLFDAHGRVVGMNTAINPAGQGIGFAIPSDEIRQVLPQLVAEGHVNRARLGVHVQDVDQSLATALGLGETRGALVGDVEKGSPAEKAGLASGDVVTRVGAVPITHARELSRTIAHQTPGSSVELGFRRERDTKTAHVTLGKLEDEHEQAEDKHLQQAPTPGALGIDVTDAEGGGALVKQVRPDSPARGSLQPGDVITEIDRKAVRSATDLRTKLREASTNRPLLFHVKRDGSGHYVVIERN
jgi:serine protease Do